MKSLSTARRYARALYQLAKEKNDVDAVVQGFGNILLAARETPQLHKFLSSPLVTPEDKQNVIEKITSNKLILKFVVLLARRKRMDLLQPIFNEIQASADAEAGLSRALIRTPQALSDTQKKSIELDLAKRLGGRVLGQFEVAGELLGGIWIKVGDKVLDVTLKGRMDDMRHALIHSAN